jgi:hypothetical protein
MQQDKIKKKVKMLFELVGLVITFFYFNFCFNK